LQDLTPSYLAFSIRPVILIRGWSPKGKKDFRDVFGEKCPRKRFNPHDKDSQK